MMTLHPVDMSNLLLKFVSTHEVHVLDVVVPFHLFVLLAMYSTCINKFHLVFILNGCSHIPLTLNQQHERSNAQTPLTPFYSPCSNEPHCNHCTHHCGSSGDHCGCGGCGGDCHFRVSYLGTQS